MIRNLKIELKTYLCHKVSSPICHSPAKLLNLSTAKKAPSTTPQYNPLRIVYYNAEKLVHLQAQFATTTRTIRIYSQAKITPMLPKWWDFSCII